VTRRMNRGFKPLLALVLEFVGVGLLSLASYF
jgi:hypothetical protein